MMQGEGSEHDAKHGTFFFFLCGGFGGLKNTGLLMDILIFLHTFEEMKRYLSGATVFLSSGWDFSGRAT